MSKHQHRWSDWYSHAQAVARGWLTPGSMSHGYTRKCLGPAGGCGLVESRRILPVEAPDWTI